MSPISGFPEWLPEQRIVELTWMDTIRRVFESYGFCSLETPSIEEIEALLAKGETDKEIYAVKRLHIIFPRAERREEAARTANLLRERGLNVEMYHAPTKITQQMRYASRKGIPYVWFPPFEEGGVHEVKNMATEKQVVADPATWSPT